MTGESGPADQAAWMPPAHPAGPSTESLPGYADLVEIGRGGDSVVFRARELALGRDVAIKVLLVDDAARAQRFAREVEITLDLGRQHPNIVTVLATGTTDAGRPAIVMEYYDGGTLHDRVRQFGPLPVEEVLRIGAVLADALSFAHDRGVLHRDVKPQNVLVLPTSWVLADFGIARLADSEHTASVETFTYRHAAPQVLDGYPPTVADDIWSLGSTLYTLVDGRPPFASDDPDEDSALAYLRRARTEPYRPLDLPGAAGLAAVVDRCLEKDVTRRWSSAAELRDALSVLRHTVWQPGGAPSSMSTPGPGPGPEGPEQVSGAAPRHRDDAVRRHTVDPSPAADVVDDGGSDEPGDHTAPGWAPAEPPPDAPAEGREHRDPTRRRGASPGAEPGSVPAVPTPVALSAVSHASTSGDLDAEPTGTGTPPAGPDSRSAVVATSTAPTRPPGPTGAGETPAPADPGRRRRRTYLVLGVAAAVVGIALGVGGAALRDGDDEPTASGTDPTGPTDIPSLTDAPDDVETDLELADPELGFTITDLRSDGSSVSIAWDPPDDPEVEFTVSRLLPRPQVFLGRAPVGAEEAVFDQAPPSGRSCYVVLAHAPDGRLGLSNRRCLTDRSG